VPQASTTASLVTSTQQFRAEIVRQRTSNHVSAWFLLSLLIDPEDGRQYVHPKRRWNSTGLHGVISKKVDYFVFQNHYEFGCEHPVLLGFGICRNRLAMTSLGRVLLHYSLVETYPNLLRPIITCQTPFWVYMLIGSSRNNLPTHLTSHAPIPVAPTWSIGHPWNASFHFSFWILDSR
jgi:hypothetical protein